MKSALYNKFNKNNWQGYGESLQTQNYRQTENVEGNQERGYDHIKLCFLTTMWVYRGHFLFVFVKIRIRF